MRLPALVVAALGLWACADIPEPARKRVIDVTLEQMLRTYAENPARADSIYRGRVFDLRAEVAAVGKDEQGRPLLEFRSATEPGGATCSADTGARAFDGVKVGQRVKVRGRVAGIRSGTSTVVFTACQIVP